jgi:hypothetical protein
VFEIIEPKIGARRKAVVDRYILLADGPFAYLKGSDGEQYSTLAALAADGGSRRTPPSTRAGNLAWRLTPAAETEARCRAARPWRDTDRLRRGCRWLPSHGLPV